MACNCRRNNDFGNIADDLEVVEAYRNTSEIERDDFYHPNCDDEEEDIDDNDLLSDMIFVDGNDRDLEVSEYEDTLMERVWWSSRPPKIPKQTSVVPARRIQIMKERLSPTVKGLPTPRETLSDEMKKKGNKRRKCNSDVKYVDVNDFDDEKQISCQTKTVTIVPECARRLVDLL